MSLGIHVHQQNPPSSQRQTVGKRNSSGGFPNPAFLVSKRYNLHKFLI